MTYRAGRAQFATPIMIGNILYLSTMTPRSGAARRRFQRRRTQ